MKPLVSIIITVFNQEKFIDEAIQSIINQTYSNWECIVVDDGSTDNSAAIVQSFVAKDERIRYFFQTNHGVSAARNLGFQKSTGQFIQFLDGDDFVENDKIRIQVETMLNDITIDVSYTGHKHYYEKNKQTVCYSFKELNGEVLNEMLFEYDNGVSIPLHTALLKREIFTLYELPFDINYKFRYEDWIFWVNIALKGARFAFINNNAAIYRIHENNFCGNENEASKHALIAMFCIANKLDDKLKYLFLDKRTEYFIDRACRRNIEQLSMKFMINLTLKNAYKSIRSLIRNRVRK